MTMIKGGFTPKLGVLYGSAHFLGAFTMNGTEVSLGEIVRAAFSRAAVTEEQWNEMDPFKRDLLILQEIYVACGPK